MISLTTKIQTVHHGAISIKELFDKKDHLVYSYAKEQKLMKVNSIVGMVEVPTTSGLMVGLDSGLEIFCTSDHPFYTFRGMVCAARDLVVGQSVRAFSLSLANDGHYRVHGFVDGSAKHQYTARMVWEYFNGPITGDNILHHKDFNKLNNELSNLELLSNSQHNSVHYPFRRDGGFFNQNHKVTFVRPTVLSTICVELLLDCFDTIIVADDVAVAGRESGIVVGA
jgi:hypothetical protein